MNDITVQNYRGTALVFLAILALAIWGFGPYLKMFILVLLASLVAQPSFNYLKNKLKSENLAVAVSAVSLLLLVIIPLTIFITMAVSQVQSLTNGFNDVDLSSFYNKQVEQTQSFLEKFLGVGKTEELYVSLKQTSINFAKNTLLPLGTETFSAVLDIFLFIFMFIFVLPNSKKIMTTFKSVLPMKEEDAESLMSKFTNSTKTVFISLVLSALFQALATGVIFWFVGVPATLFLTFAAFFLSFFPFGSGVLTLPVALLYFLSGNIFAGSLIIFWQVAVVSNVDNIIKIKLYGNSETAIPGWLTLLSTLGGVAQFGFIGVIFGPLIAVALMAITEIYLKNKNYGK